MKIVQINGFRGLVTVAFMSICLFAGFAVFPGYVAMSLWNKYLVPAYMLPILNIFQGVLIWGMIAVSYAIVTKRDIAVSFKEARDLPPAEFNMIMRNAKSNKFRAVNEIMRKSEFDMIEKIISESIEQNKQNGNTNKTNSSREDDNISKIK